MAVDESHVLSHVFARLTCRLPYPYRLFRSSTYTVQAYEPTPVGPFNMERYPHIAYTAHA